MWFVKNMAIRLSRVVLRCVPILLLAAVIPQPYGIVLPASVPGALLFLLSMLLGFLVLVTFTMLIYISAFYTMTPMGIRILAASLLDFLTGGLLPIPFFPQWLQHILYALPFGSMQTTPFLIYTGYLSPGEALGNMLIQLVWFVALFLVGKLLMGNALKKVVVQGG